MIAWAAAPARAATLVVDVRDGGGAPVSDAVITLAPHGKLKRKAPTAATRTLLQEHEAFQPYVELFRPGDSVRFSNGDRTKHHVYSFSRAKSFEMVLAPGESQDVALDRPGIVAVGCNIHDDMVSYLFVADAAFAARATRGKATLSNVPAGDYSVRIWHPQLKRDQPEQLLTLAADATGKVAFSLALRPDPRRALDAAHAGP